LAPSVGSD
jgi:mannose/fructose-specific phosphotransferase system component IIA